MKNELPSPKSPSNKKERTILLVLIAIIIIAVVAYIIIPSEPTEQAENQEEQEVDESQIAEVSAIEVKELLNGSDPMILLDVRRQLEYAETHIPGSTNIELGDLEVMKDYLPNDIEIITTCDGSNCMRGETAAERLIDWGFKNVRNFRGGIKDWQAEAFPTTIGIISETKYFEIPSVSSQDAFGQINAGTGITIIDVRNSSDFANGHLPGAENISFADIEAKVLSNAINLDLPILVYGGESNLKAQRAADKLLANGAKNLSLLDGGFPSWQIAGFKISTE
ncbi:rhodanese-like domain-containing protein [Patescibacteria group bacterium]